MRVVADTNILVSALQFGGKPKQLLDLAASSHIDLVLSEAILAEALRVFRDKFDRSSEWLTEADPSDDRILECAAAGRADVIMSGDVHLLRLGNFRGVPIQRVAAFLDAVTPATPR